MRGQWTQCQVRPAPNTCCYVTSVIAITHNDTNITRQHVNYLVTTVSASPWCWSVLPIKYLHVIITAHIILIQSSNRMINNVVKTILLTHNHQTLTRSQFHPQPRMCGRWVVCGSHPGARILANRSPPCYCSSGRCTWHASTTLALV